MFVLRRQINVQLLQHTLYPSFTTTLLVGMMKTPQYFYLLFFQLWMLTCNNRCPVAFTPSTSFHPKKTSLIPTPQSLSSYSSSPLSLSSSSSEHHQQEGLEGQEEASIIITDSNENDEQTSSSSPGDKIREANNIRPSLSPTIINSISQALLERSTTKLSYIPSTTNQPINIMVNAASLASKAIQSRAQSSTSVQGDEKSIFNEEESKLVAGRIVGVLMRLHDLETDLVNRVRDVSWVKKYGEEQMFGLCKVELQDESYQPSDVLSIVEDNNEGEGDDNGGGGDRKNDGNSSIHQVLERIKDDPLLRMCRAECIYALFLKNVEMPSMEKAGQVPVDRIDTNEGGNNNEKENKSGLVDFLDQERIDVLFPLE